MEALGRAVWGSLEGNASAPFLRWGAVAVAEVETRGRTARDGRGAGGVEALGCGVEGEEAGGRCREADLEDVEIDVMFPEPVDCLLNVLRLQLWQYDNIRAMLTLTEQPFIKERVSLGLSGPAAACT